MKYKVHKKFHKKIKMKLLDMSRYLICAGTFKILNNKVSKIYKKYIVFYKVT